MRKTVGADKRPVSLWAVALLVACSVFAVTAIGLLSTL